MTEVALLLIRRPGAPDLLVACGFQRGFSRWVLRSAGNGSLDRDRLSGIWPRRCRKSPLYTRSGAIWQRRGSGFRGGGAPCSGGRRHRGVAVAAAESEPRCPAAIGAGRAPSTAVGIALVAGYSRVTRDLTSREIAVCRRIRGVGEARRASYLSPDGWTAGRHPAGVQPGTVHLGCTVTLYHFLPGVISFCELHITQFSIKSKLGKQSS